MTHFRWGASVNYLMDRPTCTPIPDHPYPSIILASLFSPLVVVRFMPGCCCIGPIDCGHVTIAAGSDLREYHIAGWLFNDVSNQAKLFGSQWLEFNLSLRSPRERRSFIFYSGIDPQSVLTCRGWGDGLWAYNHF